MLPSLWLTNASSTPPELVIRQGEQVLGRSADAEIRLDETFVSGYHARLNWHNHQLTVLDLDSTNGTRVNGVPVVGWTSLTDGDVIEFGGVEATVRLPMSIEPTPVHGSPSPPPPPAPSSRRPKAPLGDEPVSGPAPMTDVATGAEPPVAEPPVGSPTESQPPTAAPEQVGDRRARVYDSLLGPSVSEQTEPLFDRPLTSAVTVPPTPPSGITTSRHDGGRASYDHSADSGFDLRDGGTSGRFDGFNHRGFRITLTTAIVVFVALALAAALIFYFTQ